MKFWIKLIVKTLAGGLGVFLLFSLIAGLVDALSHLIQGESCELLLYAPVFFLFNLFLGSGLDDWGILFFLLGMGFVFVFQVRPVLVVYFPERTNQIFRISVAFLLTFASIGSGLDLQKEYAIKKMYTEFCQAYNKQDYELAYSYFSPEYRSEIGIKRFVNTLSRSYVNTCDGVFIGTIFHRLNGAAIYPYSYTVSVCNLLAGPELILVRIEGKWYFTGEHHWYVD